MNSLLRYRLYRLNLMGNDEQTKQQRKEYIKSYYQQDTYSKHLSTNQRVRNNLKRLHHLRKV